MVRPSAWAVLRLIASTTCIGCAIGRSPSLALLLRCVLLPKRGCVLGSARATWSTGKRRRSERLFSRLVTRSLL